MLGGIAIGVNQNGYETLNTYAKEFTLTVIIKQRSSDWIQRVTATYGPNHRDRRGTLWDEIYEIGILNSVPWVIEGDLNVIRYAEKRNDGDHNV